MHTDGARGEGTGGRRSSGAGGSGRSSGGTGASSACFSGVAARSPWAAQAGSSAVTAIRSSGGPAEQQSTFVRGRLDGSEDKSGKPTGQYDAGEGESSLPPSRHSRRRPFGRRWRCATTTLSVSRAMPKDTGCCPNPTPSWTACETASPDDARGEWSADSCQFDVLSSDPGIVQQDERRQPSSPDALSSD